MELIKPKDFESAIETLLKNKDGTVYQKVATFDDGVDLYLVFGWDSGFDETPEAYQEKEGNTWWTICAKLAVNTDDLQCDYDIDWRMPTYKGDDVVDVYDTERGVAKLEASGDKDYLKLADYYNEEVKDIVSLYNKGELG